jgi:hypothetical protein
MTPVSIYARDGLRLDVSCAGVGCYVGALFLPRVNGAYAIRGTSEDDIVAQARSTAVQLASQISSVASLEWDREEVSDGPA